jgi:NAD(P)-dependent dehydrogenase (short-subunit alcohol dehydrogenase family)
MNVEGKVIVVTGAARGIGQESHDISVASALAS